MKIIIFGANELGAMIATELYASNDITVIDSEKNKIDSEVCSHIGSRTDCETS